MNIEQKFWNNVNVRGDTGNCWEWTAGRNSDGYGNFKFPDKTKSAHRVAWILTYGPIPEGICVLHSCDNPPCCNPEHLFLGTNQDNMNDLAQKGHLKGEHNAKAKLTAAIVKDLRHQYASNTLNQKETAKILGVCKNSIWNAVHHYTWTHLPLDI